MNTDDPKFTAHVLGELDDLTPAERAEIAALLAADADAATDAEETRALAARLRSELQSEQSAPLTDAQRAAVLAANAVPISLRGSSDLEKASVRPWRPSRVLGSLALAASVALCASLAWKAQIERPLPLSVERELYGPSAAAKKVAAKALDAPHPEPEAAAQPAPVPVQKDAALIVAPQNPTAVTPDLSDLTEKKQTLEGQVRYAKAKLVAAQKRVAAQTAGGNVQEADRVNQESQDWQARLDASLAQLAQVEKELDRTTQGQEHTAGNAFVAPGEVLQVFVNEDASFNGSYQVRRGGYIIMPRVGRIAVAGKTIPAAEAAIKRTLQSSQLHLASVLIERVPGADIENGPLIYLAGEFKKPGPWHFPKNITPTVTNSILSSGGTTDKADLTRVRVMRIAANKGIAEEVNLQKILDGGALSADIPLGEGDVVTIPAGGDRLFNVAGQVAHQGSFPLKADEKLSAYGAILQNGGFARFADQNHAYVLRIVPDGSKVKLPVDVAAIKTGRRADVALQDGDTIVVPEKFFSFGGSEGDAPATAMAGRRGGAATASLSTLARDYYFDAPDAPAERFRRGDVENRRKLRNIDPRSELSDAAQPDPETAESYDFIADNAFLPVAQAPLSTFSIDVDTASYAIVRRFLNEQKLPPKGAVRIEELINYFSYDYPQPQGDAPFSATMEVAACPWTPAHRLVRIGLKGREIAKDQRPASNLVFLIDVSGSMQPANKLPLLKQSLGLLIDQLGAEDQVAMVVYAGNSGCVLEPTHSKAKMRAALKKLEAGGSTNGASGVQLAYELAEKSFIKGGTNRVILATDGDWNVGITNPAELFELIAKKAKSGVFLTVLGYGMDNLKDSMLVKLADKGNGNYGYIDTLIEAKKLLADELTSTLVTIAKDVKIQVEFNPAQVAAYRLIGYEKRLLAKEDFNDDTKDAGEIGAGHTVTALYEVVPAGGAVPQFAKTDELKYQRPAPAPEKPETRNQKPEISPEMLTLKLRYKAPDSDVSKLIEFPLTDTGATWEKSSRDFRFAAAVAGYGMLLRDSPHKGSATWNSVRELAVEGKGEDATGYRAEFIALLEKARALMR